MSRLIALPSSAKPDMHIHILGICGTFMGGLALLARAAGHRVTGCDANVYPPMSTQLRAQGIELCEGYGAEQLEFGADMYVIGNAITRGKPLLEAILDGGHPYTSGPQWLAENILPGKWVLAVAGTHGKTSTSAMLAWILEQAGLQPGFLIGGVPLDFGISARLTSSKYFVIEADEYDTAYFDKRSKFVHYRSKTVILNNLEFDHADIFADLAAIETQFHHFVRTIPQSGRIVANAREAAIARVLDRGCWSEIEFFQDGRGWEASAAAADGEGESREISFQGKPQGALRWQQSGEHNVVNALAAIAAARHAGVAPQQALTALGNFKGVKRRMELRGVAAGVTVYDDFAHHPTAIATTIAGLRRKIGSERILAVLEPRSNTMKLGAVKAQLAGSLDGADRVFCYAANLGWDVAGALTPLAGKILVSDQLEALVAAVAAEARAGDHVLVMSNGGFGGVHEKLLTALAARQA
jgi:UDP-N-acetylmuramate: L-alanyl-gamma-D-glutamyl-meso-diaminopimelate ligase